MEWKSADDPGTIRRFEYPKRHKRRVRAGALLPSNAFDGTLNRPARSSLADESESQKALRLWDRYFKTVSGAPSDQAAMRLSEPRLYPRRRDAE